MAEIEVYGGIFAAVDSIKDKIVYAKWGKT